MKLSINWKVGTISALVTMVVGLGLFIFVGSKIDFTCRAETSVSAGCRVYHGFNWVVQRYADIWRSIFAPRCLGGNGPDDCLGPDGVIMAMTLSVIGFATGNIIWPKQKNPPSSEPPVC